ncbi:hypothetical protein ACHAXN_011934 [Cyclotella atomus]
MSILFYLCLTTIILFLSTTCIAIDPWPTINASPQYVATPSSQTSNINSCHCKFFLWDIVSYIKYCEANRQIRQNTYEGLGGRQFVRVQPRSYAETWLSQLRRGSLKKDGCCLCGYSFRDHLVYWSKCKEMKNGKRQSAFDCHLKSNGTRKGTVDRHSFHEQYVEVIHHKKRLKKKGKLMRESNVADMVYLVPQFNPLADGRPKKPWTVFMLLLARSAALERVDDLIWFSKVDSSTKRQLNVQ